VRNDKDFGVKKLNRGWPVEDESLGIGLLAKQTEKSGD